MSAQNIEYLTGVYERWGRGKFTPDPKFLDDMTIAMGPEFPDPGAYVGPEGIATYFHLWTFDGHRPIRMDTIMEEANAMSRLGGG